MEQTILIRVDYMEMGSAMSRDDDAPRRYDSSHRLADAETRHRRIVEEATTLFLEQGFGATSIGQIATAAGVSPQTIYGTYGSKAGVLSRAIDVALVGDREDAAVIDLIPAFDEVRDAASASAFGGHAGIIRGLNERVAPLIRVMEQAASSDPALAELRTRLIGAIQDDCRRWITQLGAAALRPGLSLEHAAAVMALVDSPSVFSILTTDVGWTADEYQAWLAHALPHLLLRPDLLEG